MRYKFLFLVLISWSLIAKGQLNISFSECLYSHNSFEFGIALYDYMPEESLDSLLNSGKCFDVKITIDCYGNPRDVKILRTDKLLRGSTKSETTNYFPRALTSTHFVDFLKSRGYTFFPIFKTSDIGQPNEYFEVGYISSHSYIPTNTTFIRFPRELMDEWTNGVSKDKKLPKNIQSLKELFKLKDPFSIFALVFGEPTSKEENELFYTDHFYNSMIMYCALLHFCGNYVVNGMLEGEPGQTTLSVNVVTDSEGKPIGIENISTNWKYRDIDKEYFAKKIMDFFSIYTVHLKLNKDSNCDVLTIDFPGSITKVISENTSSNYIKSILDYHNFTEACGECIRSLYYKQYNLGPYKQ